MSVLPTAGIALSKPAGSSRERIEHAARGLETQFAHMLIKSMRSASPGDPFGGETGYRDMYDEQLARELTKGRGLGLQSAIVRQLESSQHAPAPTAPTGALPLVPAATPHALSTAPAALPLGGTLSLTPASRGASLSGVPVALPAPSAASAAPPAASPFSAKAAAAAYAAQQCDKADVDCTSKESFVESIWPAAQQTARGLGVAPEALVAQAALETNWGRSMPGNSNNLFGIKATGSWSGASVETGTHEYEGGRRRDQRASFRAYGSAAESFRDYARLIGSDRYRAARAAGDDVAAYASALQKAGYATDPSYANKITAIAQGETLRRVVAKLESIPQG
jgi:flagellar protein FlgJ